jgi:hypothetical protein
VQASGHVAGAQGLAAANTSGSGSAPVSARGSFADAASMQPVNTELVGKLDSKTARAGDPVVVKTIGKTRTADGMVIPKGTRLIGRVTEVEAHRRGNQDSRLGLAFDRAELRNGQSIAIRSVIESVSPSQAAMNAAAMGDEDMFASGPVGGSMAMGGGAIGGARSGGGLLGGGSRAVAGGAGSMAGGTVNAVGSSTGNAGARVGSAAGGGLNAAGATAMGAGNGTLRGAAAGSGSLAAHATGLPGVMLGGDASGGASGMLSASRKNVHLDSGTQLLVGVSSAVSR